MSENIQELQPSYSYQGKTSRSRKLKFSLNNCVSILDTKNGDFDSIGIMPVVLSTKEVESKIMKYSQMSQQNAQKLLFLPVNSTDSPIQNSSPVNEQTEDQLEYLNMLVTFRVSELQMLLGFAGRNKTGRKTELQQRAHELLRVRSQPIQQKIRDLYKTIQQSGALNSVPASSPSPGATDLGNATMPQPQGTAQRAQATVHPYNVTTQMAPRQPPTLYNQNYISQYPPQYAQRPQQGMIGNTYPVHPDVKFRRLPFFDIISDLIKPSTLIPQTNQRMQEACFYFHLTPQQATDIASSRDIRPGVKVDYVKQVQIRFCLLETTCEQEDYFPPNVAVKVNNKLAQLPNPIPTNKPGVEPKRPPKPVNVTSLVKLSPTVPNTISVSWAAEYARGYAISIALVHKLSSHDLLTRLKQKGAKHSDYTRGLIKEKLNDDDSEISTTSLKVSLMCPLGKMRMTTPCRPITCSHFQCFDAHLFLQMNERKPTWICPVCDKPALYDNLVIDGYFQDVLTSKNLPPDINEIQLHKDGSWSIQTNEKKTQKKDKAADLDVSIEIINDDVEYVSSNVTTTSVTEPAKEKKDEPKKDVVDLTLSDSEDDEPLAKRRALNPKPDSTIKFSDTNSISSNSNQSRMTTTPGPSSVSSSGYPASPAIISLDSPSPPRTPQPPALQNQQQSCMMQSTNGTLSNQQQAPNLYNHMPYLDVESDANVSNVNPYHAF